jgi:hypothetical protein
VYGRTEVLGLDTLLCQRRPTPRERATCATKRVADRQNNQLRFPELNSSPIRACEGGRRFARVPVSVSTSAAQIVEFRDGDVVTRMERLFSSTDVVEKGNQRSAGFRWCGRDKNPNSAAPEEGSEVGSILARYLAG